MTETPEDRVSCVPSLRGRGAGRGSARAGRGSRDANDHFEGLSSGVIKNGVLLKRRNPVKDEGRS